MLVSRLFLGRLDRFEHLCRTASLGIEEYFSCTQVARIANKRKPFNKLVGLSSASPQALLALHLPPLPGLSPLPLVFLLISSGS